MNSLAYEHVLVTVFSYFIIEFAHVLRLDLITYIHDQYHKIACISF